MWDVDDTSFSDVLPLFKYTFAQVCFDELSRVWFLVFGRMWCLSVCLWLEAPQFLSPDWEECVIALPKLSALVPEDHPSYLSPWKSGLCDQCFSVRPSYS